MQSKATTIDAYLAELPGDRRTALEAVRQVILANLDKNYEEGMQYGMIGYYVPHRIYPAGYHCDPKLPLGFAFLASQKNYMSLYMMCIYTDNPLGEMVSGGMEEVGKEARHGQELHSFQEGGGSGSGCHRRSHPSHARHEIH